MLSFGFSWIFQRIFVNIRSLIDESGKIKTFGCWKTIQFRTNQIFVTGIDEWVFWLLALISPSAFAMAFDRLMVFETYNQPVDLWASGGSMSLGGMLIMLAVGEHSFNCG